MAGSAIIRGATSTGLLLTILIIMSSALHAAGRMDEDTFRECSSHCGSEHEGELYDLKLCVELCRLFELSERSPSSLD